MLKGLYSHKSGVRIIKSNFQLRSQRLFCRKSLNDSILPSACPSLSDEVDTGKRTGRARDTP